MKNNRLAKLETTGENAGCWVLPEEVTGEQKVLVRSDGTAVYVAKDIPYAAWKIGLIPDPFQYDIFGTQPDGTDLWTTANSGRKEHPRFGSVDLAISIIDARQGNLQAIVSKVISKVQPRGEKQYVHRSYEVVALSGETAKTLGIRTEREFLHMSGRKGIYINAETMLDKLKQKASFETRKRNPYAGTAWIDQVAEALAVAALRFELIKQDPDKIIVFDIEQSLRLEGETGPYLLYTYARAGRILEKAGTRPIIDKIGAERLSGPITSRLVKEISMFDKAILEAAEFLSPKEVARYSFRLCSLFNEFYESVPVNSEKDEHLKGAKLSLVYGFTIVLRKAMELIGIKSLERI
jgi:arginyl-tRNA synthetase